jgi:hypothetical protein
MKSKTKIKNTEKCKNAHDYNHIDEAINEAYHEAHPLSALRKPSNDTNGEDIPPNKRRKSKHLSLILFVKISIPHRKKKCGNKTRMVKALLDLGASQSIITDKGARDLKEKLCKPQLWQTAAGTLCTATKTSKTTFSFPELHANKEIRKSLHMVTAGLTRYDNKRARHRYKGQ